MIHGEPLIAHVFKRAQKVAPSIVATCCEEIADVIRSCGGEAIITPADLPTGTDRVHFAANLLGCKDDTIVTNLQGDMPYFEPELIEKTLSVFSIIDVDIATAVHTMDAKEKDNPGCVKTAVDFLDDEVGRALYFSRLPIPYQANPFYKHVGIYAYKFHALKRFVQNPMTPLEKSEQLEQLRALHIGLRIGVAKIHHAPLSVDIPSDLDKVIKFLS